MIEAPIMMVIEVNVYLNIPVSLYSAHLGNCLPDNSQSTPMVVVVTIPLVITLSSSPGTNNLTNWYENEGIND